MDLVEMTVVVHLGDGADERELADAARQLRSELLRHDVEAVRPAVVGAQAGQGAKSGLLIAVGTLLVSLAPHALSAVLTAFQTWADRDAARGVEIRLGEESFVGSGLTRAQQDALIAGFLERTLAAQPPEPADGDA